MEAKLYSEYNRLIEEAKSYSGETSRLKDFRKLYCMAVFKSSELPYANYQNLRVLTNQRFNKYVVDIVYIDAVMDPNRQRRESKEFFEANIITQGMKIYAPPLLSDNLVRALTPEKINKYMSDITGYGTENIQVKHIINKRRRDLENARPISEAERAFKEMFVAFSKTYQNGQQVFQTEHPNLSREEREELDAYRRKYIKEYQEEKTSERVKTSNSGAEPWQNIESSRQQSLRLGYEEGRS